MSTRKRKQSEQEAPKAEEDSSEAAPRKEPKQIETAATLEKAPAAAEGSDSEDEGSEDFDEDDVDPVYQSLVPKVEAPVPFNEAAKFVSATLRDSVGTTVYRASAVAMLEERMHHEPPSAEILVELAPILLTNMVYTDAHINELERDMETPGIKPSQLRSSCASTIASLCSSADRSNLFAQFLISSHPVWFQASPSSRLEACRTEAFILMLGSVVEEIPRLDTEQRRALCKLAFGDDGQPGCVQQALHSDFWFLQATARVPVIRNALCVCACCVVVGVVCELSRSVVWRGLVGVLCALSSRFVSREMMQACWTTEVWFPQLATAPAIRASMLELLISRTEHTCPGVGLNSLCALTTIAENEDISELGYATRFLEVATAAFSSPHPAVQEAAVILLGQSSKKATGPAAGDAAKAMSGLVERLQGSLSDQELQLVLSALTDSEGYKCLETEKQLEMLRHLRRIASELVGRMEEGEEEDDGETLSQTANLLGVCPVERDASAMRHDVELGMRLMQEEIPELQLAGVGLLGELASRGGGGHRELFEPILMPLTTKGEDLTILDICIWAVSEILYRIHGLHVDDATAHALQTFCLQGLKIGPSVNVLCAICHLTKVSPNMSKQLFNQEGGLSGAAQGFLELGEDDDVSASDSLRAELSAGIHSLVSGLLDSIHFAHESTLPPHSLLHSVGEILKTPMALSVENSEFLQRAAQLLNELFSLVEESRRPSVIDETLQRRYPGAYTGVTGSLVKGAK